MQTGCNGWVALIRHIRHVRYIRYQIRYISLPSSQACMSSAISQVSPAELVRRQIWQHECFSHVRSPTERFRHFP